MRYLGLALSSEGPTDQRFLAPLLRRVVEDVCLRYSDSEVIIPDIQEIRGRGSEIVVELRKAIGEFDILCEGCSGLSLATQNWGFPQDPKMLRRYLIPNSPYVSRIEKQLVRDEAAREGM